ncbi:hypothetical protein EVAR_32694_1 [Eumeta japonica]|uniref:Uncharacterized protein n=1 Tax=Eumeta variegata TaxID=151549 RepID=A0A4C1VPQ9_EUMVA|nr:hypothetical protein EVAR_32694_1 [Eumeta japonica]
MIRNRSPEYLTQWEEANFHILVRKFGRYRPSNGPVRFPGALASRCIDSHITPPRLSGVQSEQFAIHLKCKAGRPAQRMENSLTKLDGERVSQARR